MSKPLKIGIPYHPQHIVLTSSLRLRFSNLALRKGYNQVRIVEGDEAKMTLVTMCRIFEFLVIPFGLYNTLTTICILLNDIFTLFLNKLEVYLDDMVVFSENLEDHIFTSMDFSRWCGKAKFTWKYYVCLWVDWNLILRPLDRPWVHFHRSCKDQDHWMLRGRVS